MTVFEENGLTTFLPLERNQLKSIHIKSSRSAILSEKDVQCGWKNSSVILEKHGFYRSVLVNLYF